MLPGVDQLGTGVDDVYDSWRRVVREARGPEVAVLFLVVPLVLLAVEGVIQSEVGVFAGYTRASFRFPLTGETFWTPRMVWKAFISSYAHDTLVPHLRGNLFMYLVSMAALYPLALLTNRKTEFRWLVGVCFIVVPFVVSYSSFQLPMRGTTIGFSGIVGALLGVVPVVLLSAVGRATNIEFVPLWSTGPVLFILTGLYVVVGASVGMILVPLAFALAMTGITIAYLGIDAALEGLYYMTWPANPFCWWGLTVAIAGPYFLFFSISPETNLVSHLSGYLVGYIAALFVVWDTPDITLQSLGVRGS